MGIVKSYCCYEKHLTVLKQELYKPLFYLSKTLFNTKKIIKLKKKKIEATKVLLFFLNPKKKLSFCKFTKNVKYS